MKLVIDACVARSASISNDLQAKCSREVLQIVLDQKHWAVFSQPLREEWERHQSRLSLIFLSRVISSRRYIEVKHQPNRGLMVEIRGTLMSPKVLAIVEKDVHLVDAACHTGKIIVTFDRGSFKHLRAMTPAVPRLRPLIVANPEAAHEPVLQWLGGKSEPLPEWRLGAIP